MVISQENLFFNRGLPMCNTYSYSVVEIRDGHVNKQGS